MTTTFYGIGRAWHAEVHTRMPVALPKDAEAAWLDSALTDGAKAIDLAHTFRYRYLSEPPPVPSYP